MKWPFRSDEGKAHRSDLHHLLREEIHEVRKQGELPARDSGSFSKYFCDLCNSPFTIHDLR
jgi:hypothetical protein